MYMYIVAGEYQRKGRQTSNQADNISFEYTG